MRRKLFNFSYFFVSFPTYNTSLGATDRLKSERNVPFLLDVSEQQWSMACSKILTRQPRQINVDWDCNEFERENKSFVRWTSMMAGG